ASMGSQWRTHTSELSIIDDCSLALTMAKTMSTPSSIEAVMSLLDHSLLRPDLTMLELEAGCRSARELGVASVCLLPYFVKRCAEVLVGSRTVPSTTLAFPHGAIPLQTKLAELEAALDAG